MWMRPIQGLLTLLGRAALRAKIRPDDAGVPIDRSSSMGWEAESAAHGETTCKDENEVWPNFRRNPKGRGQFSRLRCRSSLEGSNIRRSSLLEARKIDSRRCRPNSANRP